MTERRVPVFFYGLFMDADLLRAKGAQPTAVRKASVPNYGLRIGQRAALIVSPGGRVYGILMDLRHRELEALYADPSVSAYKPEPVIAELADGERVAVLCFNLPVAPLADEHNPDYARKLRELAVTLDLPAEYVATIR